MNILFNSKIILKNNIGGKSNVCRNHCAFIKSQHINFSISNEKDNIKKNVAKNTNTGFIELYHKLLETKKIEKDPFQYKFILILQAFENNINNYYHNVEKKVENDKTSKKSFFSSFFKKDISLNIKINKLKKLVHIINVFNMQNGIIFCRTNLDCDNIYNFLNHVGDGKAYKGSVATTKENKYSCVILKGKMSNDERKNNLNAFKKGEVRFLICTDVAARGIDIQNLRYLIIMTMSDNYSAFFHKVGRVGRDGKNSLCIVLSSENEEEKVWYHNCPSRGVNCYNRNLKEEKGCTIYINESYYIKTINEMLEIPMHVIDSKYYYVENLFDPLNYLKNNLVNNNNNKSRRDQNKNQNSIFADIIHSDFSNMFDQNINNIKKLKATICCKHYELMNFAI
ncbi:Helicase conserved C-terminal domain containing protein, putative [Plasmodium berghei]|uniref:Helicase conserved C-terminal domain containing protein, putative n=1 Tax=Plasmodium berghei TaxID=5821 RepID=A0A1D3SFE9_PLABE|nr:Helicase conserved C-terminal domain containing protein, putative [Plasmodium berghei]